MLYVKSAFLQSKLDEDVFVKQPPRYEVLDTTTGVPMVMKLKQAIYGLRTASRVWHLTPDQTLKNIGLTAIKK